MYHRIVDDPVDHWRIAVSPKHFEEQLEVLRRKRRPLSLDDLIRGHRAGTLAPDAVAVTFDDGYLDNLLAGKPRLAAAGIPATVFVATGYTDLPRGFWWDELAFLLLGDRGPDRLEISIGGEHLHLDLESENRKSALAAVWRKLRVIDPDAREAAMCELRSTFSGCSYDHAANRAMTGAEIRSLANDRLIAIGAHTVTHPALSTLKPGDCRREISESKRACEALIGAPVSSFAYPYGDFDARAEDEVKASGFAYACSTIRGAVLPNSDLFALPRIHVFDTDGDAFERNLALATIPV
jgi:peptidoglycan/xylan/chitin deacetylase (PgdA/CDA1 family)